jgi:hypothetical protein
MTSMTSASGLGNVWNCGLTGRQSDAAWIENAGKKFPRGSDFYFDGAVSA